MSGVEELRSLIRYAEIAATIRLLKDTISRVPSMDRSVIRCLIVDLENERMILEATHLNLVQIRHFARLYQGLDSAKALAELLVYHGDSLTNPCKVRLEQQD